MYTYPKAEPMFHTVGVYFLLILWLSFLLKLDEWRARALIGYRAAEGIGCDPAESEVVWKYDIPVCLSLFEERLNLDKGKISSIWILNAKNKKCKRRQLCSFNESILLSALANITRQRRMLNFL